MFSLLQMQRTRDFSAKVTISSSLSIWPNETSPLKFLLNATFNAEDFVSIMLIVSQP